MADAGSGQEARPNAPSRSSRAVVVPILLILGIVVPTAFYLLLVRPPKRESYFIESRVRDLAVLNEQIEGALQARLGILRGVAWRGKTWEDAVRKIGQPIGLEAVSWEQCKPTEGPPATPGASPTQDTLRSCPTPPQGSRVDPEAGLGLYVALDPASREAPSTAATEWGKLPASAAYTKTSATLYFRKDCADKPATSAGSPAVAAITPTPTTGASQGSLVKVCGKSRLAKIVEPFITGTELDGFEVFVADGGGRILLERGPTSIGVTQLPTASSAASPAASSSRECPNPVEGLPSIGQLNVSSTVRNVIVAGSCYSLIAQPARPPRLLAETSSDGASASPSWVVGILIPKEVLDAEARTFSFGSWTSIPLLLLMILLATPALKLAFIGSRAPLTPADVRAAFFFTLAGLGIAVVTIIANLSYAWLEAQLDAQLASLSEQIRRNFADEVNRANDAVDLFAAVRATKRVAVVQAPSRESAAAQGAPTEGGTGRVNNCPRGGYYTNPVCRANKCGLTSLFTAPVLRCPPYGDEQANTAGLTGLETSASDTPPALCGRYFQCPVAQYTEANQCAYVCTKLWGDGDGPGGANGIAPQILACLAEVDPYFDMLVLSDDDGWQWEKWTPDADVTSLISIADLQSFKDVKNRNMWTLEGGAEAVIHVQRSQNTAELVATLSRRLSDDHGKLLGVVSAIVGLSSIRTPVLPPGFGAAVVQSDGKVILHSQRPRSLYENFFSESTDSERIASAVAARHATFVESDYHARTHRLYVHPIERSPWSLIVFRDKEFPRTLDLDITATWLLLYLLYLGIVAGAWVLAWALVRTDGEWVWPDVEQACAYWVASATLIALGLANAAVILGGGDNSIGRLLIGVAGPFITMAILVLALARPHEENGLSAAQARSRRRLRLVAWVVVWLGTLAVALGCLLLSTWSAVCNLLVVLVAAAVQALMASRRLSQWAGSDDGGDCDRTGTAARLRRHWRSAYVAVGVAATVVVGVLPSVAIYKDAFDLGIAAWMRHSQLELAYALAKREDRIREGYRKTLRPEQIESRLHATWDVPHPTVFADTDLDADTALIAPPTEPSDWLGRAMAFIRDTLISPDTLGADTLCRTAQWRDQCPLATRHVSGLLMASLPAYHPESGQLREMLFDRSSDGRWVSDDYGVTVRDPRLITHRGGMRLQRQAALPSWPVVPPSIPVGVLVLAVGLGLAGTYVLMWWYANQLFDLRHVGQPARADDGTWIGGHGLLLIHPSARLRQGLDRLRPDSPDSGTRWVDLQKPETKEAGSEPSQPFIIVDHLEHKIDDGADNRLKLELSESLVLTHGARCVVLSTVDPLQHFRHRLQSPGDSADHHYVTVEEIDRWARVLDRLLKVTLPLSGPSATVEECVLRQVDALRLQLPAGSRRLTRAQWKDDVAEAALAHWKNSAATVPQACVPAARWVKELTSECWWTPRLRGLAVEAAWLYDPPDEPLACIRDIARSHHRTLWATLTDQQKLILIHLGRYGFVNPRNWRALSRLQDQGLVQRAPAVRLMSQSFTDFVKRAEAANDVERWEAAAGPSAWHQIRGIVIVASVLAAVVLSQSQPELLTYVAAGLTAAATFGVTVTNFLGFLQTRRGAGGQSGSQ